MKGLLIKDIKLLKNQKVFQLVIVAIIIVFLAMGKSLTSVFSYAGFVFSFLIINTILYDEDGNGLEYLFTLPVSRRDYVLEKYVFGMCILILLLIAGAVCCTIMPIIQPLIYQKEELASVLSAIFVSAGFQAIAIPIELKYGGEKGRIALLLAIACIALAVSGLEQVIDTMQIDLSMITEWFEQASLMLILACGCMAAVGCMGISYAISLLIMKKKQF